MADRPLSEVPEHSDTSAPPRGAGIVARWLHRRADARREMYAGGRPNPAARAAHRRFADGVLPRLLPVAAVLHVSGRRSGAPIRVPIAVVPYRMRWYTVSMLGEQSNWVRNVRACNGFVTLTHGRHRAVHLTEVPARRRAPILKRYLLLALGARPHMPVAWRDPLSAFEDISPRYPTFRIDRVRRSR